MLKKLFNKFKTEQIYPVVILITGFLAYSNIFLPTYVEDFKNLFTAPQLNLIFNNFWNFICNIFNITNTSKISTNPSFHNIGNQIIFLLSIFLIYKFLSKTLKNLNTAFWASMIYSVHPTHAENLIWNSGSQNNNISICFMLSSFLTFIKMMEDKEKSNKNMPPNNQLPSSLLALGLYGFSLRDGSIATIYPLLIPLWTFFFKKENMKKALQFAGLTAIMAIIYGINFCQKNHISLSNIFQNKDILDITSVIGKYLESITTFSNISTIFSMPNKYIYSIIFFVIIGIAIYICIKSTNKIYKFCLGLFSISILPYSHIFGQIPPTSDYLAIPSLSFATALTTKILEIKEKIGKKKKEKNIFTLKGFAYTSLIAICIYYLVATMMYGNSFQKKAENIIKYIQNQKQSQIYIKKDSEHKKNKNYMVELQKLFEKYYPQNKK